MGISITVCPDYPNPFLFILSRPKATSGPHPPEGGVRFLNNLTREKVSKIYSILKTIISHAMSSMKCISFNSLNFPAHLHIRHPEKITIYTNYIFYHITSASLSWNPFIHFLHTLHSIPSPDIVTGWHILCLIYFLYNTSLNQTRTEISTFLMSLQQALLPSPPQRVHQALSLAKWPGTLPPSSVGSWHLCAEGPLSWWSTFFTSDSLPWPHVVCAHPESWQMEHYYILYLKSPSYTTYQKFVGKPSWKSDTRYVVLNRTCWYGHVGNKTCFWKVQNKYIASNFNMPIHFTVHYSKIV